MLYTEYFQQVAIAQLPPKCLLQELILYKTFYLQNFCILSFIFSVKS